MPDLPVSREFAVDAASGLLSPAVFEESPNRDERPGGESPTLIVLHGISLPPGEFGGGEIEALFLNKLDWTAHPYFEQIRGMKVSAHVLLRRDGKAIQFVSFNDRAWHAGESCFRGTSNCNDYAIGIELEGEDETAYDTRQYAALPYLLRAIMKAYPRINARDIAAHSDIAPGRKTDPGAAFDWLRLYDGLGEIKETAE